MSFTPWLISLIIRLFSSIYAVAEGRGEGIVGGKGEGFTGTIIKDIWTITKGVEKGEEGEED